VAVLSVGWIGSLVGLRLKVPAGRLVMPIFFVALGMLLGMPAVDVPVLRGTFTVVLGTYLGLRFDRDAIRRFKSLMVPCLFLVLWHLAFTKFNGELLIRFTGVDTATAVLAVVPGGIVESSIIALSFDAEVAKIATFQLARLLASLAVAPLLIKAVPREAPFVEALDRSSAPVVTADATDTPRSRHSWIPVALAGVLGGVALTLLSVPAGGLIGALVAVAFYINAAKKEPVAPPAVGFYAAQAGMGAVIGLTFTRETMSEILTSGWAILGITAVVLVGNILFALVLNRRYRWGFHAAVLGILPGGVTPMIVMAKDAESDITVVGTLQLARLLTVVVVFPPFYGVLLGGG
jgi:uncharacterized protein